ncbi:MAG TPA: CRISPR-associated endonuclease Cas2 [Fimbriimonadaceae bacterium]|nr:CRISPR-associated endonuclease Cas2 [Fimbriimonadaceae bacterium]
MWVLVFFDLPTETRAQRTEYRRFREKLLQDGFVMLQYSVYARSCANFEDAEKHGARVERMLPPEGEVRMLTLTSQQYARMRCFFGEISRPPEQKPLQLEFF